MLEALNRPEARWVILRHLMGIAAGAIAALLRHWLIPVMGYNGPYLVLYPLVMATAVVLGVGPGLLAASVGIYAAETWLVEPLGVPKITTAGAIRIALIMAGTAYVGIVGQRLRRARQAAANEADSARQGEEQLRLHLAVLESTANAIVITDPDGAIQWVNPSFTRLTGYASSEVTGKNPRLLKSGEQPADFYQHLWSVIKSGNVWRGELCNRKKDGSTYYEEMTVTPIKNREGAITHFIAIKQDISERKAGEDRAASLARFSEESPLPILRISPDGVLLYANPAAEFVCNAFKMRIGNQAHEEFTQACDAHGLEREVVVGDRVFSFICHPGKDGMNIYGRDITERMEAEMSLRAATEELQRSNRELEQFASMVSHDLQQPMVVIGGYMNLLQRTAGENLPPKAQHYVQVVRESAETMQQMIRGMLDYARVESRGQPFAPVNLEEVLTGVMRLIAPSLRDGEITHDPLPVVSGDRAQLMQLLQNLLSNALKFRDPMRPLRVHIGAVADDKHWLISIRDNGIGIPGDEQEKLFKIFYRARAHQHIPGTGIGLAICKRIVERHGGSVCVESQAGKGAVFYIELPLP